MDAVVLAFKIVRVIEMGVEELPLVHEANAAGIKVIVGEDVAVMPVMLVCQLDAGPLRDARGTLPWRSRLHTPVL